MKTKPHHPVLTAMSLVLLLVSGGSWANPLVDWNWMKDATVAQVQAEIANGVDPYGRNQYDRNALETAVFVGNAAVTAFLITDHGMDVNLTSAFKDRATLLHAAVHSEGTQYQPKTYRGMIDLLIDLGADPDTKNANGQTPLHRAAANDFVKKAEALLDGGASLTVRQDGGSNLTPAGWAAAQSSVAMLRMLLERGAALEEADSQGQTLLMLAVRYNGNPETLAYLLGKGADVRAQSGRGVTALHLAAYGRDAAVLDLLLDNGLAWAVPVRTGPGQPTPYEVAVRHNLKRLGGTKALARLEALHKEAGLPEPEGGWATRRRVTGPSGEDR